MGQKTHPIGLRLGIVKTWDSRWFAKRNYADLLREDLLIKRYLKKRLYQAGISKITIERKGDKVTIGIRTARPGLVIGRKGEQVDKLSEEMKQITKKQVQLNIEEIKRADLDAQLVAEHIAKQLEQRGGRMRGRGYGGGSVRLGEHGRQALEPAWVTNRQIEAARVAITRSIKRGGKMWIRVFPDKPVTKKPAETRMGKGKGAPESWVAVVKPGKVLFEMEGVDVVVAKEAMRLASHKLPLKTRFVSRHERRQAAAGEGG